MQENFNIEDHLCANNDLTIEKIEKFVQNSLHNKVDDGDLYIESTESESIFFDENTVKDTSFHKDKGFGLRGVMGEATAYSHASDLSMESLIEAKSVINSLSQSNRSHKVDLNQSTPQQRLKATPLYPSDNSLNFLNTAEKINLLTRVNDQARSKNSSITQVSISLYCENQKIAIFKPDQELAFDVRPLLSFRISLQIEKNGKVEKGSYGFGGRDIFGSYISEHKIDYAINEALNEALLNFEADPAPAGNMDVVLGPGWPGILLHEAIGHGLEGDFNRKKTSVFSELLGQKVASEQVTVIDDGTMKNRRGSLTIDDEGTPTQRTTLIENGVLTGYLQDRLNSRLMGTQSTGNGRRESYDHIPMPRMTNTFMENGQYSQAEIISNVKNGIYASNFNGGQVDITSGNFVFSGSSAYLIENGKITHPIKGATFIGNGAQALKKISMVGNDLKLDDGIGTCGKDGQSVPVGVGMPTILIKSLTVGGTQV